MKREIKFRAWDDLHNKMYPVSDIEWDADGRMWVTADDGKNGIELIDEEAHLMQYTGLHDKNGRKIYEGDIVHGYDQEPDRDDGYIGSSVTGVVNFKYGAFWIGDSLHKVMLMTPPIVKVIGNVHENPDLLEGKHEQK